VNRFWRRPRGGRLLVAVAIGGALFGVATAVQASIPDSSGVAHSCYFVLGKLTKTPPRPGALRVIDTAKGQTCAADEQAIDLASASDVQHSQFVFTFGVFQVNGTGQLTVTFTCGSSAWVATSGTIAIAGGQPLNTITQIDSYNSGGLQNSATNGFGADSDWKTSFNYTQANVQFHPVLQCVLADHVFGNAYGTAPVQGGSSSAAPGPAVHLEFTPSS
jgi:hypothetical protein